MLADVLQRFHYLKVGLAVVLVFVGGKMLLGDLIEVPVVVSLGVVATLLLGAACASWLVPRIKHREGALSRRARW